MGQLDVMGIGDRVVELRGLDSLTRLVLGKNAMKNMEVLRLGGSRTIDCGGSGPGRGSAESAERAEVRRG